MPNLRVFNQIAKEYQRLGYLKRLVKRVVSIPTSNLDNLGTDLIDIVSRKFSVPLTQERVNYIKIRLFDRVYKSLKEQTESWVKNGGEAPIVQMEIQDLYLSDANISSSVGKLNKADWNGYPLLGVNLGFIRGGTFSANTRAFSLLHLIPDQELKAFTEFLPESNPFRIDLKQALLFLYSFLENDGEVFIPLLVKLANSNLSSFNDREAGDFLPEIYQSIISRYRKSMLAINLRERLEVLEKSASSIAAQQQKERYSGGSSREHASRPRLEPYVDIGLFSKPNPMKFEYSISPIGQSWANAFAGQEDSAAIEEFLFRRFFETAANSWKIDATPITSTDEIVTRLQKAAKIVSSSSGYAPIEELALLSGIESLIDDHQYFEIGTAREAIIAFQKANPYKVRFTVDRMGTLAHAKFIEEKTSRPGQG